MKIMIKSGSQRVALTLPCASATLRHQKEQT